MSIESLNAPDHAFLGEGDPALPGTSGYELAAAEMFRRYSARLVRLCFARTGDAALAEDIAQTTLLRAMRFLRSYQPDRPMWPWLRAIALRQCATVERRQRERRRVERQAAAPEVMPDPSESVVLELFMQSALDDLPARQRRALQLRYLEDVDHQVAADIIGVNRNAFDQLLTRGRTKLAAAFAEGLASQGVGLVALIAFVRRVTRRGVDAGTAGAAPLMGASLAVAAGVAAMLSLQLGVAESVVTPSLPATQVSSVVVPASHAARPAHAPAARVPATRSAPAAQAPVVQTYLAPHALGTGGRMADDRLTVATPVGTVSTGTTLDQDRSATVCGLLAGKNPAVTC